jgi:hypothetical protein
MKSIVLAFLLMILPPQGFAESPSLVIKPATDLLGRSLKDIRKDKSDLNTIRWVSESGNAWVCMFDELSDGTPIYLSVRAWDEVKPSNQIEITIIESSLHRASNCSKSKLVTKLATNLGLNKTLEIKHLNAKFGSPSEESKDRVWWHVADTKKRILEIMVRHGNHRFEKMIISLKGEDGKARGIGDTNYP